MGIKGNEVDKAAKEAIDIPVVTTIRLRLPYTDYYLAIRRARNSMAKRVGKIVVANKALKIWKKPTTVVGNMTLG